MNYSPRPIHLSQEKVCSVLSWLREILILCIIIGFVRAERGLSVCLCDSPSSPWKKNHVFFVKIPHSSELYIRTD